MATNIAAILKVRPDTFFHHHRQLLSAWEKDEDSQLFDGLIIRNGKDIPANKIKTAAFSMWYFGFDFVDSVVLITKKSFILIAGSKKIVMMNYVTAHPEAKEFNIELIERDSNDNNIQFKRLFSVLQGDLHKKSFKIGTLLDEPQTGPFMLEYDNYQRSLGHRVAAYDCSYLISDCLAVKDLNEIQLIGKAAQLSVYLEKKLIRNIERVIDEEEKETHLAISQKIQGLIEHEKELKKISDEIGGEGISIDLAYPPVVQSGGKYDLNQTTKSSNDVLQYDTIIASIGAKYMEYHASIIRTLFINPTLDQKRIYQKANELQSLLVAQLKPGMQISKVYENAVAFIKEKIPEMKEKLPLNFGFGMGLERNELNLEICDCNDKQVEEGMVFNVMVGFSGLQNEKDQNYAIQISDTVAVRKLSQPNSLMTYKISRKYEDISYCIHNINNYSDSDDNKNYITKPRNGYNKCTTVLAEKARNRHQLELRQDKLRELQNRLLLNGFLSSKVLTKTLELEKVQCYKTSEDIPQEYSKNQISVDQKHSSVLLPINGQLVPFHVSLIKNYAKIEEGKTTKLRLTFFNPFNGSLLANITFPKVYEQVLYIKDITFRSKNGGNMSEIVKKIKELQAKIKQNELEAKYSGELISQDSLQLRNNKRPALRNLKIRPLISKLKSSGMLELHLNGFRYLTTKNEKIDIVFSNIKHAIYQPCENDKLIIAIHFHFKNPIYLGKKKVFDIQYFTEAGIPQLGIRYNESQDKFYQKSMEYSKFYIYFLQTCLNRQDLQNRGQDFDEEEEEEEEKARRKKLTKAFEAFIKEVETQQHQKIKFEVPLSHFGFEGSPGRTSVYLQPTQKTLMSIIQSPFFIITLDEIEVTCFERMISRLRTFDLVLVFKDYDRAAKRLASIPMEKAEMIKNWLDSVSILFYESTRSYSWGNLLRTIKQDVITFVEDGGWNIILGESEGKYLRSNEDWVSDSDEEQDLQEDYCDSISDDSDDSEKKKGDSREEIGEDRFSEEEEEEKSQNSLEENDNQKDDYKMISKSHQTQTKFPPRRR